MVEDVDSVVFVTVKNPDCIPEGTVTVPLRTLGPTTRSDEPTETERPTPRPPDIIPAPVIGEVDSVLF